MFKYGQKLKKVRMLVTDINKIEFKEKDKQKHDYFYEMKLQNHKDTISAVLWNADEGKELLEEVKAKGYATIAITGAVKSWDKKLQLNIKEVKVIDDDPTNYQISVDDIENIKLSSFHQSYLNLLMKIEDDDVRKLVLEVHRINNLEEIAKKGVTKNKQYIGGYLETVVKNGALSLKIAETQLKLNNYTINKDLLIAGIMLKYLGNLTKYTIVPEIKEQNIAINSESLGFLMKTLETYADTNTPVNISDNTLFKLKCIVNDESGENFTEKKVIEIAEKTNKEII